jgi:ABC-type branched-subunit amino acid transport system substrate-binding protein
MRTKNQKIDLRTPPLLRIILVGLALFNLGILRDGAAEDEGKGKSFRFGISAPLSGVLAEYGAALRNGFSLAQRDFSTEFASVDVFFEDSQWDPKTAVSVFNALARVRNAQLVYSWGTPTNEAVAPLAEALKVSTLAMTGEAGAGRGRRFIVRTVALSQAFGSVLADHLLTQVKPKRIAVVLAENGYLRGIFEGLQERLKGSAVELELLATFEADAADFRTVVSKMKNHRFDIVGVLLITGQVRNFFKQMREQRVSLPTFGGSFFGSVTEIEASGEGIQGAIFPDLKVDSDFRDRYLKEFGNDIQIAFAANAYDVAALVAKNFAAKGAGEMSPEDVMAKLRGATSIDGAHSQFRYSESTDAGAAFESPIVVRRVEGKGIVDLGL